MADSNQQTQMSFSDVKSAITQMVNDNTSQNNAIAAQLQEVQRLVTDFASKSQSGNAPSQADFQGAIAQLQAIHSLVQQNTASIQASTTSIQNADPSQAGTPSQPPSGAPASSATGSAGSSSTVGGSAEPGTGAVNQTPAGPATVGENTTSGHPL